MKLLEIKDKLPITDFSFFVNIENREYYEVIGKKFELTADHKYVLESLEKAHKGYGHRARQAANNEGVDWKAMSHALRAGIQIKEIYLTGDLKFPLKDASFLRGVKQGKFSFKFVLSTLENLLDEVEQLSLISNHPSSANKTLVNEFIYENTLKSILEEN